MLRRLRNRLCGKRLHLDEGMDLQAMIELVKSLSSQTQVNMHYTLDINSLIFFENKEDIRLRSSPEDAVNFLEKALRTVKRHYSIEEKGRHQIFRGVKSETHYFDFKYEGAYDSLRVATMNKMPSIVERLKVDISYELSNTS